MIKKLDDEKNKYFSFPNYSGSELLDILLRITIKNKFIMILKYIIKHNTFYILKFYNVVKIA